ncbi:MAG: DUF4838 domain-containing protein [Candidatus Hydrogenedens sp.]|nr:DUF4838 domain-containing protein [Candidatus Hydrogenedens sp.]
MYRSSTRFAFLLALILMGCAHLPVLNLSSVTAESLLLAENGETAMTIVISENAPEPTRHAAQELQYFLQEITGAELAITDDSTPAGASEIWLGNSRRYSDANILVDYKVLGKEGYLIRTRGNNLLITGGEPRGVLYGVYGLLEDHLGCRWFTPEISSIPEASVLAILPIDEVRIPVLEYREPFVTEARDGNWAARNRMNSQSASLGAHQGGKVTYHGFVHTFNLLIPPEEYFDEHPEYFSLINGERVKDHSQLCCTNEEVMEIVTERIRKNMAENPEATVFSVSQNDWANYCECERCTELAEEEGSQIGPVLHLVNHVARAVRNDFPDKVIDTLAYQYTRKPPKNMRPEPNVIIRLCSIECDFSHPFEDRLTPENRAFCDDLEEWAQVANRLWIWNYNTSFHDYLVPFPNLNVRGPNVRYLIANNVRGIFEQDVYNTPHGEFNTLSAYLGAKLLWNPNYDTDLAVNEFLSGVYGAAATPLRLYLDLIHDAVKDPATSMNIWISPDEPFLTDELLARADELFEVAEKAVADDPVAFEQVQIARLSVDFTIMEHTRLTNQDAYVVDHEKRTVQVSPEFQTRALRFFDVAERNGLTRLREVGGELGEYKKEIFDLFPEEHVPALEAQAEVPPLKAGAYFRYYKMYCESLPDFSTLHPTEEGVAPRLDLGPTEKYQPSVESLLYTGYIEIPRDGVYAFSVRSNDGSRLKINDTVVVDNDGLHKAVTVTGFRSMEKGFYPFELAYFDAGGDCALEVFYSGPDIPCQPLPESALFHE